MRLPAAVLLLAGCLMPLPGGAQEGKSLGAELSPPSGCSWGQDSQACRNLIGPEGEAVLAGQGMGLVWLSLCVDPEQKGLRAGRWSSLAAREQRDLLQANVLAAEAQARELEALLGTNLKTLPPDGYRNYSLRFSGAVAWLKRCPGDRIADQWLARFQAKARELYAYALERSRELARVGDERAEQELLTGALRILAEGKDAKDDGILGSGDRPAAASARQADPLERDVLLSWLESRVVTDGVAEEGRARKAISKLAREMLKAAPLELLERLARQRPLIVVIPKSAKLTDLPQFEILRGQRSHDGRDEAEVRGIANVPQSDGSMAMAVAEENLLGAPASETGYISGAVFIHEFAHVIHLLGMSQKTRLAITSDYWGREAAGLRFPDDYAGSTEAEYFAMATEMWFKIYEKSRQQLSDLDKVRAQMLAEFPSLAKLPGLKREPAANAKWIRKNDEAMLGVLSAIYGPSRRLAL